MSFLPLSFPLVPSSISPDLFDRHRHIIRGTYLTKNKGPGHEVTSSTSISGARPLAMTAGAMKVCYPFHMKKTENWTNTSVNPTEHGFNGNVFVQTVVSTDREYHFRNTLLESFAQISIGFSPPLSLTPMPAAQKGVQTTPRTSTTTIERLPLRSILWTVSRF